MEPYYTYILRSLKDDSFYIGQTSNLDKRLVRHNAGQEKYTSTKTPWEVFWFAEVKSRTDAMRLEKKLKNMKSRKRILEFIKKGNG